MTNLWQTLFMLLSIMLFIAAAFFGAHTSVNIQPFDTRVVLPTYGPAGAACGLGLAGGLCCVAAALCELGKRRERD